MARMSFPGGEKGGENANFVRGTLTKKRSRETWGWAAASGRKAVKISLES